MMKYIHIIIFLLTHDLTELKECWSVEFLNNKKFKWSSLFRRMLRKSNTYLVWYRLASEMYKTNDKVNKKIAHKINEILKVKYSIDISPATKIGIGLKLTHSYSITIINKATIGKNCSILQNVTIGSNGKDVEIKIGDNVKIGAMTFINKDIPSDCTVYTEKNNIISLS